MGHVLSNGLELMGTGRSLSLDKAFKDDIDNMVTISTKVELSQREKDHVKAIQTWADG